MGLITQNAAISEISSLFRNHAINQGRIIDDTYHNGNGIHMRLKNIRYLFHDGKL